MSVCRGTAPPRAAAAPGKGRMRACACAFIVHEKEGVRVLQMAKSDKKRCPKGGWADYRSGPWYKLLAGLEQGAYMKDKARQGVRARRLRGRTVQV